MPAKKITNTKRAKLKDTEPQVVIKKEIKLKTAVPKVAKSKSITLKVTKPERTDVFVSYSHADKKWLTEMRMHLTPLGREHDINIWDDTKIQSGEKWRAEIDKALSKSKVAILLVSARFMASDFITKNELPPLLNAAEKEGLIILTVIVGRNGAFANHPINIYQAINSPTDPLNLLNEGQVDEVFSQLYNRIHEIFIGPSVKILNIRRSKQKKSFASIGQTAKQVETSTKPSATKKSYPLDESVNARSSNALLVKRTGEWLAVPVAKGKVGDEISLELHLTTSSQRAFVSSLRQNDNLGSIVFRSQTYICKSQDIQMQTNGTREVWLLKTIIQAISRRVDVTYGLMKPEKQAELNARVLLLDQTPANEQSSFGYYSNHTQINNGHSPLPALYQQLGKQALAFKQIAPLIITWFLQTNNIVEHIHKMTFNLKADNLTVRFEGERSSQHQNESIVTIKVEGICDLSKTISDKPVKLAPLSRY